MTEPGDAQPADPNPDLALTLGMVRQNVLNLVESLPVRPERVRVAAADVVVDVDWRRPAERTVSAAVAVEPASVPAGPAPVGAAPAGPPAAAGPAAVAGPVLHYVTAPSVGTFYRSPEPGATPFTSEGSEVRAGQPIAIIEAMKLMLPVESDRAGRVVEVLIEDGQAVEYGERLLALVPAGAE